MEPGLYHMLFISTTLFFIGVYGFFTRRNLVTMLMSVELILKAIKFRFTLFNINSTLISIVTRFLLVKKPYTPMKNSDVLMNSI